MSADLFAEFNSPPPPQRQQHPPPPGAGPKPQASASQDPFGFIQGSNPLPPTQQVTQPWPSFQSQPSSFGEWGGSSNTTPFSNNAPQAAADDDGWGDFEFADSAPSQPSVSVPHPDPWQAPANPSANVAAQEPVTGRLVRASTLDIINNNLVDIPKSTSSFRYERPPSPPTQPRPKFKEPHSPNVMFDAAEFELEGGEDDDYDDDDDEFGDFETVAPPPPPPPAYPDPAPTPASPPAPVMKKPAPPPPSMDLLSLDELGPPAAPSAASTLAPARTTGTKPVPMPSATFNFGATKTPAAKSPVASKPSKTGAVSSPSKLRQASAVGDDEWSAWDDFEPTSAKQDTTSASQTADNWNWDAVEHTPSPEHEVPDDAPPPINVPPPSVLLSAFPSLFSTGNSLFKPVAGQSSSIKQRVLSDPKAVDFLRGYILIATTAARVIAGRKHRWHRDKILAKSMSISAAGSKGMKLAGVDKTQSTREDREAADVADAWREHVGKLRSAVAAANSAGKASLKVPEISDNIPVHTAKLVPTAPKPCVICGLKRDERVAKVDFDVEDSFGEWWVDHWGHRACKNFWVQHEQMLRQR